MGIIETCEQYVLAELHDCKAKLNEKDRQINVLKMETNGLRTELESIVSVLNKVIKIDDATDGKRILRIDCWERYEKEDFDFIVSYLHEKEEEDGKSL